MASQVSPGVVIKERELSSATIVGALDITGAIASTFKKGPVGEIVNISTERELIDTFGSKLIGFLRETYDKDWKLIKYIDYEYFSNGDLYILKGYDKTLFSPYFEEEYFEKGIKPESVLKKESKFDKSGNRTSFKSYNINGDIVKEIKTRKSHLYSSS